MRLLSIACLGLVLGGCAGYVRKTTDLRRAYESSDYDRALALVEKEEKKVDSDDKLLLLLDKGMILHSAGRFEDSIKVLAEAERLSGELDHVSITEEATTLLANESARAYRGEDFEKLMISVLQALNYASLEKDEDALVEVRRVNLRLQKMISDEKKPYEQLAIARYLSGILYEDQKLWDDAFIDYQEAYKLQPDLEGLADALVRVAKKSHREEVVAELKEKFPDADGSPLSGNGELVVVIEAGLSPEKFSRKEQQPDQVNSSGQLLPGALIDIPEYRNRWSHSAGSVTVGDQTVKSTVVTSLSDVAQVHLKDRLGRMLLKAVAATAVKAGAAAVVGVLAKDEKVGLLTFFLLNANNTADTRSWLSLPAEFQVARMKLPPGEHTVTVNCPGRSSQHGVTLQAGRLRVLAVRCY